MVPARYTMMTLVQIAVKWTHGSVCADGSGGASEGPACASDGLLAGTATTTCRYSFLLLIAHWHVAVYQVVVDKFVAHHVAMNKLSLSPMTVCQSLHGMFSTLVSKTVLS